MVIANHGVVVAQNPTFRECRSVYAFRIEMRSLTSLILSMLIAVGAQPESNFVVLTTQLPHGIIATQGTWNPSKIDIAKAEDSISQIATLAAIHPSNHLDHPERDFKQYVPIRQAGRNLLYVNGFCKAPSYWHTQLVVVLDGGSCYWQALYDPATDKYSNLTVNGRA
jgi:hypothetical protein